MRIFQNYTFTVHKSKVPFKDMFDYADGFLTDFGAKYKEVLFNFETYDIMGKNGKIERFVDKFPYWSTFGVPSNKAKKEFTNQSTEGNQPNVSVDLERLRELMSKVPRPLNLPGFIVKFDGIDWLNLGGDGFFSFERSIWPNGAVCELTASIEMTGKILEDGIVDNSLLIEALNERFFVPPKKSRTYKQLHFTQEERERIDEAKRQIEPMVSDFNKRTSFSKQVYGVGEYAAIYYPEPAEKGRPPVGKIPPMYSVKAALKKVFGERSYRFQPPADYYVFKKLKYGYQLGIIFHAQPCDITLFGDIFIRGLQFDFQVSRGQLWRNSQESLDEFAEDCRQIAIEAEQTFTEPLEKLFGATPDWYFN